MRLDTRQGEFISPDDHARIAWGARAPLAPTLAPSPCPSHTRDRMARPSRRHPGATYYLCADGSLYRIALGREEEVAQLATKGAGFDLFMEHSHAASGELIVSNRSGTIWRLGEEQKPLRSPSAPARMIELEGTPLVLVQGMEGELKPRGAAAPPVSGLASRHAKPAGAPVPGDLLLCPAWLRLSHRLFRYRPWRLAHRAGEEP